MKVLKILIIALLVLVIAFLALGFINPTIEYDCSITVDKPIEECWAIMSDETRVTEWIEGFQRTELISGPPNTVGAVSNMYVKDGGQEMMMTETITKFDAPSHIAMDFTMDFMDMKYDMKLADKNGRVEITSTTITEGNGMFARSIVSLMPSTMKMQEQKNLDKLKTLINTNTKSYFPGVKIILPE